MAGDISTIQSLKAVDAWIDVINANINGGVRTAFKSSRLTFAGSNVDVSRTGNATSLPLQFPEPGLTTAHTVIDFSQGAITASPETTHLAIQGDGFFLLASPDMIDTSGGANTGYANASAAAKFLLTRDGEFHANQLGLLVHSSGYYLVSAATSNFGGQGILQYGTAFPNAAGSGIRAVYNDVDHATNVPAIHAVRLSQYLTGSLTSDVSGSAIGPHPALLQISGGKQSLRYSTFGSTIFDFGFRVQATYAVGQYDANVIVPFRTTSANDAAILAKSLEASNASMTQSVPELSLAQKLFSALTKVLQTKQTNVDGVLNLVR
jgi:flagellar hook protein FlgE